MKTFRIEGKTGRSEIHVGERLENLSQYLPKGERVIITDTNVKQLYGQNFPEAHVIKIGTGEANKTLDTVRNIYDELVAIGADRSTFIIGIGGGIVCDVTGFVASTFMRGLRFGFVATTLLAQVDASVGGKNGVNLEGFKNLVGVFNQPEFVICDPVVLRTLSIREIRCGMAEIVKHALIADAAMFEYLETHIEAAMELESETVERLVYDSVRIKAEVVNRDETETGERRKLNFGHTLGHAFEKLSGVAHGEAVAAGMTAAAKISVMEQALDNKDVERIKRVIASLGLPVSIKTEIAPLVNAIAKDKKREGSRTHFVLLSRIGEAYVRTFENDELTQRILAIE